MLSNPLLVDVIESAFIPLLIHNNSNGEDTKILKKFNEPAWNYQVIRFLDKNGADIIPRKDKVWTMSALLPRIEKTLKLSKIPVPETLKLLKLETEKNKHNTIALAMHCFWTGEMRLGSIDGVVTTEAGWYDNREVTLITYHQDIIDLKTLIKKASEAKCANSVYLLTDHEKKIAKTLTKVKVAKLDLKKYTKADDSDQKRQMRNMKFNKLELTPSQVTKVNAFARTAPEKAKKFLTTKQLKQLEKK